MAHEAVVAIVGFFSGAIASVAGFGIGSLLTPLFALQFGTGLAVAAVSIAHFFGTGARFILLRKHLNKKVFISFGLTSAAGGLLGALLHNVLYDAAFTLIFGILLLFAGFSGLFGFSKKMRLSGPWAWLAGGLSGFFGGLVGNQGGIRSAALLNFELAPEEYIATATGVALLVDVARVPVYVFTQGAQLLQIAPILGIATLGVLIGTFIGGWLLKKIPERIFTPIVSLALIAIGVFVLAQI